MLTIPITIVPTTLPIVVGGYAAYGKRVAACRVLYKIYAGGESS